MGNVGIGGILPQSRSRALLRKRVCRAHCFSRLTLRWHQPTGTLSPRHPEPALQPEGVTMSSRQPSRQPNFTPSLLPARHPACRLAWCVPRSAATNSPADSSCRIMSARVGQHCCP